MRKYFKLISFSLLVIVVTLVSLLKLNIFKVNAEDITLLTQAEYETYLSSNAGSVDYYSDYNSMIQSYFTSFNILSEDFESRVFGKGTEIGRNFTELATIINGVTDNERLSVCFDTCHTHDYGYQIKEGFDDVINEFDHIIGAKRISSFHESHLLLQYTLLFL